MGHIYFLNLTWDISEKKATRTCDIVIKRKLTCDIGGPHQGPQESVRSSHSPPDDRSLVVVTPGGGGTQGVVRGVEGSSLNPSGDRPPGWIHVDPTLPRYPAVGGQGGHLWSD